MISPTPLVTKLPTTRESFHLSRIHANHPAFQHVLAEPAGCAGNGHSSRSVVWQMDFGGLKDGFWYVFVCVLYVFLYFLYVCLYCLYFFVCFFLYFFACFISRGWGIGNNSLATVYRDIILKKLRMFGEILNTSPFNGGYVELGWMNIFSPSGAPKMWGPAYAHVKKNCCLS